MPKTIADDKDLLDKPDPELDDALSGPNGDMEDDLEIDPDQLTDEEKAALSDDMSAPDVYDPDLEDDFADPNPAPVTQQPAADKVQVVQVQPAVHDETAIIIPPRLDFTAELAALAQREADLATKFEDGQISDSAYSVDLKAIAKEQGRYEDQTATNAAQIAEARAKGDAAWTAAAQVVKAATPELFTPDHIAGFNRHVEAVSGDPRNAKLTFAQQITKAQALYALDADRPDLAPVQVQPRRQATTPGNAPKPQPIRAQPVPTLARVPAAATNDTDGDRFAALNVLLDQGKIEAHERALARMTPDQRESYGNFEG